MITPIPGFNLNTFKDTTLIIPSISIANIPQFVVDLLIHSFDFEKVAVLDDLYLHPFSSPIDYSCKSNQKQGISNSAEIYYSVTLQTTLIQQRSPIIKNFIKKFATEVIVPFIETYKFNKLVLLDSSDAGLLENYQQHKIDFFTNEDILNKSIQSLSISQPKTLDEPYEYSILFKELINNLKNIEINVFLTYVYEGDNFKDAKILANEVISAEFNKKNVDLIEPVSWSGVYGDRPIPIGLEEGLYS